MSKSRLGTHPPIYIKVLPLHTQGTCDMKQLYSAPWHGALENDSTYISYISCNNFGCNGKFNQCMNMYVYRVEGLH